MCRRDHKSHRFNRSNFGEYPTSQSSEQLLSTPRSQPHSEEQEICQDVCSAWFGIWFAGISGSAGVPGEHVHGSSTLGQVFARQKHVNSIPSEYSSDISYQSVFLGLLFKRYPVREQKQWQMI